jgi:hypothetical protein
LELEEKSLSTWNVRELAHKEEELEHELERMKINIIIGKKKKR